MNQPDNFRNSQKLKFVTNEKHIQIRLICSIHYNLQQVADQLGLTWRQARHTCSSSNNYEWAQRCRAIKLGSEQVHEIEPYIRSSWEGHRVANMDLSLAPFSHFDCGKGAMGRKHEKRGYWHCFALCMPAISDVNRRKRISFAQTHLVKIKTQWSRFIWINETLMIGRLYANSLVMKLVWI